MDGWPANSPDLSPIENILCITDETMRLRFAWETVTFDTLEEFAHSMPRRLEK